MKQVKICRGTGCNSAGAENIHVSLLEMGIVDIQQTGCHGFCSQGPIILVDDTFYPKVQQRKLTQIIENKKTNESVQLYYQDPKTHQSIRDYFEIPFYKHQTRLILENCGKIDPENIEEYIEIGGYSGLQKAIESFTEEQIIEYITEAGLRGRGGAGFPTGLKWKFTRNTPGETKYVIINADEGDPGAFMDRSILEADPHSTIEGLIIGAYAIGATHGIIYIRTEYPLAIKRFTTAVKQARDRGFLGTNILNSRFSFDISINEGAGAFVCGEETALIQSLQGNRGIPLLKPPFPAVKGLWGKPTNINNVKTWSAVSWIFRNNAQIFKSIGTENASGTVIFSLTGRINNSGLIEVPMGTTLRTIIYDIGGGIPESKQLKAIQTGGPSGGCIPPQFLDTPLDYESMAEIGSIMGSGGMVVIDQDTCIVDFAKFFLEFTQQESCGKCIPCREGTLRALNILQAITHGEATLAILDELEQLSYVIKDTSLCGLGQTAPNPVLSSLKYFKEEYIEHIVERNCKAGVCPGLFKLKIDEEACKNCGICQRNCSFNAIQGNKEDGFVIVDEYCEGCKNCIAVCPAASITILEGAD